MILSFISTAVLSVLSLVKASPELRAAGSNKVIGYHGLSTESWYWYDSAGNQPLQFTSDLTSRYTHINYAFATIHYHTATKQFYVGFTDAWADYQSAPGITAPTDCFAIPTNQQCGTGSISLVPYIGANGTCPDTACYNPSGAPESTRKPTCEAVLDPAGITYDWTTSPPTPLLCGHYAYVMNKVKKANPQLKYLISIGGWYDSNLFSAATEPQYIDKFVTSIVEFVKFFGFDGVDFDWEYPGWEHGGQPAFAGDANGNGNAESMTDCSETTCAYPSRSNDMAKFNAMVTQVRAQLKASGKTKSGNDYLISMAAPAGYDKMNKLDVKTICSQLDYINIMTYDIHGEWESTTNHQAPLYDNTPKELLDPNGIPQTSVDFSVNYWINNGCPANQVVVGVPFYGHAWTAADNGAHGLFQKGSAPPATVTKLNYVDISADSSVVSYWDTAVQASYGYSSSKGVFYSYDTAQAISAKVGYGAQKGLGGFMVWPIVGDDSNGTLLKALTGAGTPPPPPPQSTTTTNVVKPSTTTTTMTTISVVPVTTAVQTSSDQATTTFVQTTTTTTTTVAQTSAAQTTSTTTTITVVPTTIAQTSAPQTTALQTSTVQATSAQTTTQPTPTVTLTSTNAATSTQAAVTPCAAPWNANTVYANKDVISYSGHNFQRWINLNPVPGDTKPQGGWTDLGACVAPHTTSVIDIITTPIATSTVFSIYTTPLAISTFSTTVQSVITTPVATSTPGVITTFGATFTTSYIATATFGPCYPAFQAGVVYAEGSQVSLNGVNYIRWKNPKALPGASTGGWTALGPCGINTATVPIGIITTPGAFSTTPTLVATTPGASFTPVKTSVTTSTASLDTPISSPTNPPVSTPPSTTTSTPAVSSSTTTTATSSSSTTTTTTNSSSTTSTTTTTLKTSSTTTTTTTAVPATTAAPVTTTASGSGLPGCYSVWSAQQAYPVNSKVSVNKVNYNAKWYQAVAASPVENKDGGWETLGACDSSVPTAVDPNGPPPVPSTLAQHRAYAASKSTDPIFLQLKNSVRINTNVDFISPGNPANPENVKRVERIVTPYKWNVTYFSMASPEYTYPNFLKSVGWFAGFCDTYPGKDSDAICKKLLATMFAHFAQETGGHDKKLAIGEWQQSLVYLREMMCTETNTISGCYYNGDCTNPVFNGVFTCGKGEANGYKAYFGRGAHQLSYSFNYGPFSQLMYNGDASVLLNKPELVADTWLNLASAIFFFVYPQPPKPSMLWVMDGTFVPSDADIAGG
ncbi:UNVERIFIED_CONTAM: hypothetical protein HDU68_001781, partial [Siphonaria sp. JEL0065]